MGLGRAAERQRYVALDGLRGVAALGVVLFHLGYTVGLTQFQHGYLAVDFFFILSGFVIADAYDGRLRDDYSLTQFAVARVVRLYPMIVIGVTVGTLVTLALGQLGAIPWMPLKIIAARAGLAVWLIPLSFSLFGVAPATLFPLDAPLWSLMCEVVANAAYGVGSKLGLRNAWPAFAAICGLALVVHSLRENGVQGGGSASNLHVGLFRVGFGFFAGATLWRFKDAASGFRLPGWIVFAALAGVLLLPYVGRANWIFEDAAVFLAFPAIVLLGSRIEPSRRLEPIMLWAGAVSYPLYALHGTLLILAQLAHDRLPKTHLAAAAVAIVSAALFIGVAHLVMVGLDEPIRAWLRARLRLVGRAPEPLAATAP